MLLFCFLVAWALVRDAVPNLIATAKGTDYPRHRERMLRMRQDHEQRMARLQVGRLTLGEAVADRITQRIANPKPRKPRKDRADRGPWRRLFANVWADAGEYAEAKRQQIRAKAAERKLRKAEQKSEEQARDVVPEPDELAPVGDVPEAVEAPEPIETMDVVHDRDAGEVRPEDPSIERFRKARENFYLLDQLTRKWPGSAPQAAEPVIVTRKIQGGEVISQYWDDNSGIYLGQSRRPAVEGEQVVEEEQLRYLPDGVEPPVLGPSATDEQKDILRRHHIDKELVQVSSAPAGRYFDPPQPSEYEKGLEKGLSQGRAQTEALAAGIALGARLVSQNDPKQAEPVPADAERADLDKQEVIDAEVVQSAPSSTQPASEQLATVHPIHSKIHTPKGVDMSVVAAEGGLGPSIRYAEEMVQMCQDSITSTETTAESLVAAEWDEQGDAVGGFRRAQEHFAAASAELQTSLAALEEARTVQEAYQATPEAGNKQSLLSD